MKTVLYGYRADVIGLLWMAAALFFCLALSSYYPLDPSFNSVGTLDHVRNKCGYIGSFTADLLYQLFGLGAWMFVFLTLRQSVLAFQRKFAATQWTSNILVWALSVFVCSSLLELHQKGRSFFEGYIYPGGVLGRMTIQASEPLLHATGQLLILWLSALILFILITKSSVSDFAVKVSFFLKKSGIKISIAVFSCFRGALIKISGFCVSALGAAVSFCRRKAGIKEKASRPSVFTDIPPVKQSGDKASFVPVISAEKDYFFQEEREELENKTFQFGLKQKGSPAEIKWALPAADLLNVPFTSSMQLSSQESRADAERLKQKLEQFSISGEITHIRSGPIITLFEFKPDDHIKIARITQMEDDLMIALKSKSIRIIAPIPGKDVVGIETAHTKRQIVYLKHLIDEPVFWKNTHPLPVVLGRHVDGRSAIQDLGKIPHLMVAGSTGSGKSVFIVSVLLGLLFRHTPQSLRLLLVDPKRVDLSIFAGLPHLLAPPVRESKEAVVALQWCLREMHKRYRSLSHFQARDLHGFNKRTKNLESEELQRHKEITESLDTTEEDYYFSPQPYICMVLEEFGDLMSSPERGQIESAVVRLAQMARACGMHLILSMQSPRKDVVTGLIKTNIPGRISFKVSSRIDSRIILDEGGAERLLSQGDMLYLGPGQARPERYHGPFVKEKEVLSVVQFWRKQVKKDPYVIKFSSDEDFFPKSNGEDIFLEPEDQKYEEIFAYVSELKEVSASHLQRKYGLGYPRAARLIDRLEVEGVVGPARGSKPREVLVHK